MDFAPDKDVEKLVRRGLTKKEAVELIYLWSLGLKIKLTVREEARKEELIRKMK